MASPTQAVWRTLAPTVASSVAMKIARRFVYQWRRKLETNQQKTAVHLRVELAPTLTAEARHRREDSIEIARGGRSWTRISQQHLLQNSISHRQATTVGEQSYCSPQESQSSYTSPPTMRKKFQCLSGIVTQHFERHLSSGICSCSQSQA